MPVEKKQLWADLALLSVAAVWGGTFVAVQNAVNQYPVFAFLALRFALATVGMCLLFGKRLRRLGWQGWGAGALIGVFLFVGYAFQTMGLKYTSATKAGLITGFQTVSVPIMTALLARRFPARQVILATILAVVGLGLLSIRGDMALEQGDLLVLICAISFGAHITAVGLLAPRMDAMALTIVQLAFVAIASAGVSLFTEGIPLPIPNEVGVIPERHSPSQSIEQSGRLCSAVDQRLLPARRLDQDGVALPDIHKDHMQAAIRQTERRNPDQRGKEGQRGHGGDARRVACGRAPLFSACFTRTDEPEAAEQQCVTEQRHPTGEM